MAICTAIDLNSEISGYLVTPRVVELLHSLQDSELDISLYGDDGKTIVEEPLVQLRDRDYGRTHLRVPLRELIDEAAQAERDEAAEFAPFDLEREVRHPGSHSDALRQWKAHRLLMRLQAAFIAWDQDEQTLDYGSATARVAAEEGA